MRRESRITIYAALLALLLLVPVGCIRSDEPESDDEVLLREGDTMPWFEVTTLTGEVVSPATLSGHESVIVFFNTSCPDCRRELPEIQLMADREPDVSYICIARDEEAGSIIKFWNENNLTMPVAPQSDRAVYNLFARIGIPRLFRFNKDLQLLYSEGE